MAKLSAHGAEIHRVEKTVDSVRVQLALMEDAEILAKKSFLKPDGSIDFCDGWKRFARLKPGVLADQWLSAKLSGGWSNC